MNKETTIKLISDLLDGVSVKRKDLYFLRLELANLPPEELKEIFQSAGDSYYNERRGNEQEMAYIRGRK